MLERLFGKKKQPKTQETASEIDAQKKTAQSSAVSANGDEAQASSEDDRERSTVASGVTLKPTTETSTDPGHDGPEAAVDLERAIIANARHDTPETRQKLYEELLFSNLLLTLSDVSTEGAADAATSSQTSPEATAKNGQEIDGQNINVAILKNPSGMQFAAAFTSGAAARAWRAQGGKFVSIRGRDIYKLLEPSPADVIVINPGSAPFVVLPKVDYMQLAIGVVPQNPQSPVHMPPPAQNDQQSQGRPTAGQEAKGTGQGEPTQGQVQVAFPPDVFSADQTSFIKTLLMVHTQVEAAVFGAIRPPGAKESEWVRTIFVRAVNIKKSQEAVQAFTNELQSAIVENKGLFKDTPFEIGMMPDPQFWVAMHQNNLVLFDKNPPSVPAPQKNAAQNKETEDASLAKGRPLPPSGVVDAKIES